MERKGNQVSIKRVDSTGRRLKQSERQGTDGRYYCRLLLQADIFIRTDKDADLSVVRHRFFTWLE